MNTYIFIYKHNPAVCFVIHAVKYYEAVLQMELLHGPQKAWQSDYTVIQNGTHMQYAA